MKFLKNKEKCINSSSPGSLLCLKNLHSTNFDPQLEEKDRTMKFSKNKEKWLIQGKCINSSFRGFLICLKNLHSANFDPQLEEKDQTMKFSKNKDEWFIQEKCINSSFRGSLLYSRKKTERWNFRRIKTNHWSEFFSRIFVLKDLVFLSHLYRIKNKTIRLINCRNLYRIKKCSSHSIN